MGKQEVIDVLTDDWQTTKQITEKLEGVVGYRSVCLHLRQMAKRGEIYHRFIAKGRGHIPNEYKIKD